VHVGSVLCLLTFHVFKLKKRHPVVETVTGFAPSTYAKSLLMSVAVFEVSNYGIAIAAYEIFVT
jgi:hypothetical protein